MAGEAKDVKKRLLFLVNVDWFFLSHRLPIAIAARNQGYEVHIATSITDKLEELKSHGLVVHPLAIWRSRVGLISETRTFWEILAVFKNVRPQIVHLVTIKPVILGGIAARLTGVPGVVAAISGLGFVFIAKGAKAAIVRALVAGLYRLALGKKNLRIILQNTHNRSLLLARKAVKPEKVVMIRGSGVDLSIYQKTPEPDGLPVVTLAARLLRDKGVCEFVEAARLLAKQQVRARFWLAGDPDPGNPHSISQSQIDAWRREGSVELLGFRKDIEKLFAASQVIVLPSYYGEGLPKVLIEAAACGRAVVTTDHPGCRDAIEPGHTGMLVPAGDAVALAAAILHLLEDNKLRQSMGNAGRQLAEREFAIEKIVTAHLAVYQDLARFI
ncbi:MAG: glycosyltransferase family 4 protein [Deltaproteobacteria bacterium]